MADPLECLLRLGEQGADAVILDATGSFLEVCQKIKKLEDFVPIMVISSRVDVAARVEALQAGADDFVTRPCDGGELCARVQVLIRTRRRFLERARPSIQPGTQPRGRGIEDDGERDSLTGLPNQRFFTRRLEDELARATRESETLSVMAVDLDGLDEVNGRFGRGAGDRLIVACARAVERACRDEDILARSGGDELVAILPGLHFAGAARVAERVLEEVAATAILDSGSRIPCQASVGIASYPGREIDSSKDLLRFAHAALARAKSEGRGQVCLYQHQGYLFGPAS